MLLPILVLAGVAAQSAPGQILIDRGRTDRAPAPVVPVTAPKPKRPRPSVAATGTATPIAGIRFIGAKAPRRVAEAGKAFLGKPASSETLQDLAAALSDAYGGSPIALYTIAIPEQDFAGGVVTVHLTEGRIVKAAVKGEAGRHRLLRARMAPMLGEAPLSRRTFERQVSLMRTIPGMTFDTDFTDPDGTGALAMTVVPKQRRHKFSFGVGNRGVDLLGDGQYDLRPNSTVSARAATSLVSTPARRPT